MRLRADEAAKARIDAVRKQLDRIVASGRHGELNRRIKAAVERETGVPTEARRPSTPRRLLAGAHDIDAFAHETLASDRIRLIVAEVAG